MALHKIVVKDFKSYKDTHTFGPLDPFSCIVGLNGSGKSNLMDAVCFALTVKPTYLRASTLVDVINKFACDAYVELYISTDNRKENKYNKNMKTNNIERIDNESMYASMSNNSNYKENIINQNNNNKENVNNKHYKNTVLAGEKNIRHPECENYTIIKRTINNKGTSHYYINNKNILYADYLTFLHRINIFPKSKNFIIFQGEIDSISLKDPKDMVKLIEDVSESVKYKKNYELAESNMNALFAECQKMFEKRKEMTSRMKEISDGKQQEKRFKEKVTIKDKLYAKVKLCELKNKCEEMQKIKNYLERLDLERVEVKKEVDQKDMRDERENLQLMKEAMEIEREIENLIDEIKVANKKELEYQMERNSVGHLKKSIDDIKNEIKNKSIRINKIKTEMEDIKIMHNDEIEQIVKRLEKFTINNSIEAKFYELEKEYQKSVKEVIKEIDEFQLEIKPRKDKNKMLEQNNKDLIENVKIYTDEMQNVKTEIENTQYKIIMNEASINVITNKQKDGLISYQSIADEEKKMNDKLSVCIKEILSIKNEQKESEGRLRVNDCIEYLKLNVDGVYGKVVDLIKVAQKKYETAISVLMSGFDQAVIVDNEKVAIKCIEIVKQRRVGRITFLPLSCISPKEINYNLRSEGIMAIDTISTEDIFQKVINFILGNALIATQTNEAKNLLYIKKFRCKVCTLDGVLFHKNGNITGGRMGNRFADSSLNKFLTQKNELMSQLQNLKIKKSAYSHIEAASEKIAALSKENEELAKYVEQESTKLIFLQDKIDKFKSTITENSQIIKQIDSQLSNTISKIKDLNIQLEKHEKEVFKDFVYGDNIKDFKYLLENRDSLKDNKIKEYNRIKNIFTCEVQDLEAEIVRLNDTLLVLSQRLEKIVQNNNHEKQVQHINNTLQKKRSKLTNIRKACNISRVKAEQVKSELKVLVNKLMILDSDANEQKKRLARVKDSIMGITKMIIIEEIILPYKKENLPVTLTLEMNENDIFENLQHLNFSQITEPYDYYTNAYQKAVKDVEDNMPVSNHKDMSKTQMYYGKVNSDYEELRKEALFAKEKFNEIKNKRFETFMACYDVVSRSIGEIYRSLTKRDDAEGNAYLLLENNTEPYKEGLKYFAMPPAKRYREMQALSGGEKTMAALALLFSIHAYKPAPFYFFDEMDSALDKMNVSSIVDYIASSDVQFIVITLKPSFFQHADGLVGIYKCEDSSRVLTYRFD